MACTRGLTLSASNIRSTTGNCSWPDLIFVIYKWATNSIGSLYKMQDFSQMTASCTKSHKFHRWPASTTERSCSSGKVEPPVGNAFQCQEMQRDDDILAETTGQILPAEQHHFGPSQQLYILKGHYLQHPKLVRANFHLLQEGHLTFRILTSEPQGLPTTTEKNRLHLPRSVTHRIWSSILGPPLKEGHQPTRGRPKKRSSLD